MFNEIYLYFNNANNGPKYSVLNAFFVGQYRSRVMYTDDLTNKRLIHLNIF